MSLFPFNGSAEATIDEVLGDSYRVVRDIHANLAAIKAVAMSLIDLEALTAAIPAIELANPGGNLRVPADELVDALPAAAMRAAKWFRFNSLGAPELMSDDALAGAVLPHLPVGLNGKSAYEVAVQNGFVGSESQWLDSLTSGAAAYAAQASTSASQAAADRAAIIAMAGNPNGLAQLDSTGVVPASQLPSYVDDVVEAGAFYLLPPTGEPSKIYVTTDTVPAKIWRWTGSVYAEIVSSPGSTDSVNEGTVNLYFTNARAVAAVQSYLDAKANTVHGHTIADVTGLQTALNGKQPAGSYAPTIHSHAIGDVTGLQAALDDKAGKSRVLNLALLGSALTANEVFAAVIPPVGETWTVPANFTGATGKKHSSGVNPAASYVITVKKNGTTVGSITISTSGVVSFATSAGAFSLVGGADVLELVGPATAGTAVGYAFAIPVGY